MDDLDFGRVARDGVTRLEYADQSARGMRWCFRDRAWESISGFGRDRSRMDGLTTSCRRSLNVRRTRTQQIGEGRRG